MSMTTQVDQRGIVAINYLKDDAEWELISQEDRYLIEEMKLMADHLMSSKAPPKVLKAFFHTTSDSKAHIERAYNVDFIGLNKVIGFTSHYKDIMLNEFDSFLHFNDMSSYKSWYDLPTLASLKKDDDHDFI